jgi:hypothetical protein
LVDKKLPCQLTTSNVSKHLILFMITTNGEKIRDYLENTTYEFSLGCTYNGHRYSQNGTNSCVICGKIK